jgi:hypothetical protein
MIDGSGARRGRRRAMARLTAPAGALAAAALLAAACGGGPASQAGSSGAAQGRLAQALAFAHCMRSHGAPNYPDPDSAGGWDMKPSNSASFRAPQSARTACVHLLPRKGGPLTPAQQAQHQRENLEFDACIRRHGFPGFPDGWSGNVGQLISAGIDPNSPRLNAALTKCGF